MAQVGHVLAFAPNGACSVPREITGLRTVYWIIVPTEIEQLREKLFFIAETHVNVLGNLLSSKFSPERIEIDPGSSLVSVSFRNPPNSTIDLSDTCASYESMGTSPCTVI